jgi:hypothetical protein
VLQSLENLDVDLGGFQVHFAPGNRIGSRRVEVTLIGRDGTHLQ